MRVVLSDTSPIHYLVLIGEVEVLRKLYGRVLIPSSVAYELDRPQTPSMVRTWISQPPDWIEIVPLVTPQSPSALTHLDEGERDVLLLALNLAAHLLLMDDREGVEEATRLGFAVTGTLGVLDRAAQRSFLNLAEGLARLRTTNFRASAALLDHLLDEDARRRGV
jgi:predicted nucleic acid-binding protein